MLSASLVVSELWTSISFSVSAVAISMTMLTAMYRVTSRLLHGLLSASLIVSELWASTISFSVSTVDQGNGGTLLLNVSKNTT
jgi:hypothetical protein